MIVRVKNGVAYAMVELRPMGIRSNSMLKVPVYFSGGNRDLGSHVVRGRC